MTHDTRLVRHGFALFLIGLLTGLAVYQLENPRMGVISHLEGIMNGMFLVMLGLAWDRLRLPTRARRTAFRAALLGAYANWAITFFAAAVGTSKPILAGAGFRAADWQEALIAATPLLGVGAPILCIALVLWGLREGSSESAA